jgi:Family of unknown function (DUF6166)
MPGIFAASTTMKVYQGIRTQQGCEVTVREDDGPPRTLDMRLDIRNHSPTGPEWNYAGSGPAQLALALLADALGDDEQAQRLYQDFKFKVVGRLPHDGWTMTDEDIRAKLREIQRARRSRAQGDA